MLPVFAECQNYVLFSFLYSIVVSYCYCQLLQEATYFWKKGVQMDLRKCHILQDCIIMVFNVTIKVLHQKKITFCRCNHSDRVCQCQGNVADHSLKYVHTLLDRANVLCLYSIRKKASSLNPQSLFWYQHNNQKLGGGRSVRYCVCKSYGLASAMISGDRELMPEIS